MSTERAVVRGALVGVTLFFPATFGVTLLAGGTPIAGLSLAAFGSLFGGFGFGAMLGAVINLVRLEEAENADREQTAVVTTEAPAPRDGARPSDLAA
jgi:hypothetical protein